MADECRKNRKNPFLFLYLLQLYFYSLSKIDLHFSIRVFADFCGHFDSAKGTRKFLQYILFFECFFFNNSYLKQHISPSFKKKSLNHICHISLGIIANSLSQAFRKLQKTASLHSSVSHKDRLRSHREQGLKYI